ncbi:UNKNOWN [Stylonychia lemnae]|uniref:Uncharacterized protein n=1 Tax=Stylonychia lemnae TaxID=5949 RepID=A0A078B4I9_STYLE|nr:UNKNOWN [Stylonychia lemnae]|eukprot:CDW88403.1 UNKNOWN [Stylonychia lemnae]
MSSKLEKPIGIVAKHQRNQSMPISFRAPIQNVVQLAFDHLVKRLDENFEIDTLVMTEIRHNKPLIQEFMKTSGSKHEYRLFQNLHTIIENQRQIKIQTAKNRFKTLDDEKIKEQEEKLKQEKLRQKNFVKNDLERVQEMFNNIIKKCDSIDRMAEEVEDNNIEAQYKLSLIEEDRPQTLKLLGDEPPGEKIREMMEIWDNAKIDSNYDLEQLQGELWVTAEEFEKKLEDDIKGYQIERQNLIDHYLRKIDQQKKIHCFYLESLEISFNDYKMKHNRDMELTQMMLNDYQSKIMNEHITDEEINKLLIRASSPSDMEDAIVIYLTRLINDIQSKIQLLIKVIRNFQVTALLEIQFKDLENANFNLEMCMKKILADLGCEDVSDKLRIMIFNKEYQNLKKLNLQPVYDKVQKFVELKNQFIEIRNSMKNCKLHLIDELWGNNEIDRRAIVNALMSESLMELLGVDLSTDEFQIQLNNPQKYKPSIAALQTRVIMKTRTIGAPITSDKKKEDIQGSRMRRDASSNRIKTIQSPQGVKKSPIGIRKEAINNFTFDEQTPENKPYTESKFKNRNNSVESDNSMKVPELSRKGKESLRVNTKNINQLDSNSKDKDFKEQVKSAINKNKKLRQTFNKSPTIRQKIKEEPHDMKDFGVQVEPVKQRKSDKDIQCQVFTTLISILQIEIYEITKALQNDTIREEPQQRKSPAKKMPLSQRRESIIKKPVEQYVEAENYAHIVDNLMTYGKLRRFNVNINEQQATLESRGGETQITNETGTIDNQIQIKNSIRADTQQKYAFRKSSILYKEQSIKSVTDQCIMTDISINPDQILNMRLKIETLSTLSNLNELITHQQNIGGLILSEDQLIKQPSFGLRNHRGLRSKNTFQLKRNSLDKQPFMSTQYSQGIDTNNSLFDSFNDNSNQLFPQHKPIKNKNMSLDFVPNSARYNQHNFDPQQLFQEPVQSKNFPFPKSGNKFFPNLTKKLSVEQRKSQIEQQMNEDLKMNNPLSNTNNSVDRLQNESSIMVNYQGIQQRELMIASQQITPRNIVSLTGGDWRKHQKNLRNLGKKDRQIFSGGASMNQSVQDSPIQVNGKFFQYQPLMKKR